MINTTGIQSTGPQGLPGSTSQPAIANEQNEAQFNVMMAAPKSSSSVGEPSLKLDEFKSKLDTAKDNLNAAEQTGDQVQMMNAHVEYRAALFNYETAYSLQNGAPA
jgi:hypothetical protein